MSLDHLLMIFKLSGLAQSSHTEVTMGKGQSQYKIFKKKNCWPPLNPDLGRSKKWIIWQAKESSLTALKGMSGHGRPEQQGFQDMQACSFDILQMVVAALQVTIVCHISAWWTQWTVALRLPLPLKLHHPWAGHSANLTNGGSRQQYFSPAPRSNRISSVHTWQCRSFVFIFFISSCGLN